MKSHLWALKISNRGNGTNMRFREKWRTVMAERNCEMYLTWVVIDWRRWHAGNSPLSLYWATEIHQMLCHALAAAEIDAIPTYFIPNSTDIMCIFREKKLCIKEVLIWTEIKINQDGLCLFRLVYLFCKNWYYQQEKIFYVFFQLTVLLGYCNWLMQVMCGLAFKRVHTVISLQFL